MVLVIKTNHKKEADFNIRKKDISYPCIVGSVFLCESITSTSDMMEPAAILSNFLQVVKSKWL